MFYGIYTHFFIINLWCVFIVFFYYKLNQFFCFLCFTIFLVFLYLFDSFFFYNIVLLLMPNTPIFYILDFCWTSSWFSIIFYLTLLLLFFCYFHRNYLLCNLFIFYIFNAYENTVAFFSISSVPLLITNVNLLLTNVLNKWHPWIFYISTLWIWIFILFFLAALFLYSPVFVNYHVYKYYNLFAVYIIFLLVTLFLGAWWASQEGTWGGWWNWDPSEFFGLNFLLLYLFGLHFTFKYSFIFPWVFFFLLGNFFLVFNFFITQLEFAGTLHSFGIKFFFFFNNNILFLEYIYLLLFFFGVLFFFYYSCFSRKVILRNFTNRKKYSKFQIWFFLFLGAWYTLLYYSVFNTLLLQFLWTWFNIYVPTSIFSLWFLGWFFILFFLGLSIVRFSVFIIGFAFINYLQYAYIFVLLNSTRTFNALHYILFLFLICTFFWQNNNVLIYEYLDLSSFLFFNNTLFLFGFLKLYYLEGLFFSVLLNSYLNSLFLVSLILSPALLFFFNLLFMLFWQTLIFINVVYLNLFVPYKLLLFLLFDLFYLFFFWFFLLFCFLQYLSKNWVY